MEQTDFVAYQTFFDKNAANEMAELLNENQIEFLLEDNSYDFDPSFTDNQLNKEYVIKLRKADFENIEQIQTNIAANFIYNLKKDYYLFDFTNEELLEIVYKKDEWNQLDFILAQKLLKERGIPINEEQVENLRVQRIKELAAPEEDPFGLIIFGYISVLLGGVFAILIGAFLSSNRKILPNGDRVYWYKRSDRRHGIAIFILGIVSTGLWIGISMSIRY